MTVPFTFANASGRVPAAELDANFAYVANNVSTANIVVFAAQPNITSVGNLTSLRVNGSVTSTQYIGNGNALTNIPGANVVGAVTYATTANAVAGANVVGAVTYATTANAVAGANVSGAVALATLATTALAVAGANVSGQVGNALVAGTVYTNAQPNITSVGTLSSLSVTGNARAGAFYGISINSNTGNLLVSANTGTPELNWTFINDYSAPGVASLLGPIAGFNQRSEILLPGRFSTGILTFTGPDYAAFPDSLVIAAGEDISIAQTPGGLGNAATYVTTFNTNGNWAMPGNVSAVGNVDGNYFTGNGRNLTGILATSSYDNANVTALLSNLGSNVISGTGNITTTANISGNYISGNYISGNGSQLTGLYSNANTATFLAAFGSNTISTTGNVTVGNVLATGVSLSGNVLSSLTVDSYIYSVGNITTASNLITQTGYVYAGGNITGGNVLTGGVLSATGNISTSANVLVTGYVSVAGNVRGGNIDTIGLITATGNIETSANVLVGGYVSATGNVDGNNIRTGGLISAAGNVRGGNITSGGFVTAAGNVTAGNVLTGGILSAAGNVRGSNINTAGNVSANAISITGFAQLPQYSIANVATLSGDIGYVIALTDSDPIGALAFWNGTGNAWCYIANSTPV
jgi:hypothetical protein